MSGTRRWQIWQHGPVLKELALTDPLKPLLESYEKHDHPAQQRLQAYLANLHLQLHDVLHTDAPLYLHMDVDVEIEARLQRHHDLENYLTPVARRLGAKTFALASATKYVGGGSRLRIGVAQPQGDCQVMSQFTQFPHYAGSGPEMKERLRRALEKQVEAGTLQPLAPGPTEVHLAFRSNPTYLNWVNRWKPIGDAMGPILGLAHPNHPYSPNDDRITALYLHRTDEDTLIYDTDIAMWWRLLQEEDKPTLSELSRKTFVMSEGPAISPRPNRTPPLQSRAAAFAGCLLGGAVGDALGAAVEFESLKAIRARFGPSGIRDYAPAYGLLGAITDDTQMTLFTAEGLLRAYNRGRMHGVCHLPSMIHMAYLRWLQTQGDRPVYPYEGCEEGWLLGIPALHNWRAPGKTCLSALRSGVMGTIEQPLNTSKGCGGVMRVAPFGLAKVGSPEAAFQAGCEAAALTHGHPSGYLAAGFLAAVIASVADGSALDSAIKAARTLLLAYPDHEECLTAVDAAVRLAKEGTPTAERVEQLGAGWVAEEALAIALYCALCARDFEQGVLLAVNHSGDSDSTGAITGNILGAMYGSRAIPARWLASLELRKVIATVADDLFRHFGDPAGGPPDDSNDYYDLPANWDRYPGY